MGKRKDNPNDVRNIIATMRLNQAEYDAIKKRYGSATGLRDAILKELGFVSDQKAVKDSGTSLN